MEFNELFFGCGDYEESEADAGGKEEKKAVELKYVQSFFQIVILLIFCRTTWGQVFLQAVAEILSPSQTTSYSVSTIQQ